MEWLPRIGSELSTRRTGCCWRRLLRQRMQDWHLGEIHKECLSARLISGQLCGSVECRCGSFAKAIADIRANRDAALLASYPRPNTTQATGGRGFEAVLSRKRRMTPAVAAIFDGEREARLIALASSKPPKGRARWTLRLLESKRASDSTIGRTLKKTVSSRIAGNAGSSRRRPTAPS
jgi:hypothetical protein